MSSNEEQARQLVFGVKIWGYYESEASDEGSVFPFSDEAAALAYANSCGLERAEIVLWQRGLTADEESLVEYGAWLALEARDDG